MNATFFSNRFVLSGLKVFAGVSFVFLAGCSSPPPPTVRDMPPRIETPVQAEAGEIDPAAPHQAPQNEAPATDAPEGAEALPEPSGGIRYLLNGDPISVEDLQSGDIPENSTITIMAERHVPYSLVTDALLKIHEMGYLVNFGVEEVSSEDDDPAVEGTPNAANEGASGE